MLRFARLILVSMLLFGCARSGSDAAGSAGRGSQAGDPFVMEKLFELPKEEVPGDYFTYWGLPAIDRLPQAQSLVMIRTASTIGVYDTDAKRFLWKNPAQGSARCAPLVDTAANTITYCEMASKYVTVGVWSGAVRHSFPTFLGSLVINADHPWMDGFNREGLGFFQLAQAEPLYGENLFIVGKTGTHRGQFYSPRAGLSPEFNCYRCLDSESTTNGWSNLRRNRAFFKEYSDSNSLSFQIFGYDADTGLVSQTQITKPANTPTVTYTFSNDWTPSIRKTDNTPGAPVRDTASVFDFETMQMQPYTPFNGKHLTCDYHDYETRDGVKRATECRTLQLPNARTFSMVLNRDATGWTYFDGQAKKLYVLVSDSQQSFNFIYDVGTNTTRSWSDLPKRDITPRPDQFGGTHGFYLTSEGWSSLGSPRMVGKYLAMARLDFGAGAYQMLIDSETLWPVSRIDYTSSQWYIHEATGRFFKFQAENLTRQPARLTVRQFDLLSGVGSWEKTITSPDIDSDESIGMVPLNERYHLVAILRDGGTRERTHYLRDLLVMDARTGEAFHSASLDTLRGEQIGGGLNWVHATTTGFTVFTKRGLFQFTLKR